MSLSQQEAGPYKVTLITWNDLKLWPLAKPQSRKDKRLKIKIAWRLSAPRPPCEAARRGGRVCVSIT
jgi:hypothetical protein